MSQSMAQPYVTPMMNARSLSSRSAHSYNCSSSLRCCCFIVSLNNDEKLQRSSTGCEQVLERGGTKSEIKVVVWGGHVCSNQQKYVLLSTRPPIKPDLDTFKKMSAACWNDAFKYNIYFPVKTHFLSLLCFYTQLHWVDQKNTQCHISNSCWICLSGRSCHKINKLIFEY